MDICEAEINARCDPYNLARGPAVTSVAVLGVLVAVAISGLWRPEIPIFVAVTLWIAVPTIASQQVTHLHYGFHPSSVIIVVTFIAQLVSRRLNSGQHGHIVGLAIAGTFVFLNADVDTTFMSGHRVLISAGVVNQILAPFLLFLLISFYFTQSASGPARMRNLMLTLATAEALYSIPQGAAIKAGRAASLPFASSYERQYWFPALTRPLGTTDHPLVLGLLLASCIPLVVSLRSTALQIAISTLLLFSIASASDRAATVVGTIALVYVLVRGRGSVATRFARLVVTAFIFGLILVSSVGAGIMTRLHSIGSSDPSTALRIDAYGYFFRHWLGNFFVGGGVGSTSALGSNGILGSSFENPLLIDVFEIGVVATVVVFGSQLYVLLRGVRVPTMRGACPAAAACLLVSLPFNSTTSASACAPILWTLLALAYSSFSRQQDDGDGDDSPASTGFPERTDQEVQETHRVRTVAPANTFRLSERVGTRGNLRGNDRR